jgi:hypothetical protein
MPGLLVARLISMKSFNSVRGEEVKIVSLKNTFTIWMLNVKAAKPQYFNPVLETLTWLVTLLTTHLAMSMVPQAHVEAVAVHNVGYGKKSAE